MYVIVVFKAATVEHEVPPNACMGRRKGEWRESRQLILDRKPPSPRVPSHEKFASLDACGQLRSKHATGRQ